MLLPVRLERRICPTQHSPLSVARNPNFYCRVRCWSNEPTITETAVTFVEASGVSGSKKGNDGASIFQRSVSRGSKLPTRKPGSLQSHRISSQLALHEVDENATCDFWTVKRDSCIRRYPSGVCPSPAGFPRRALFLVRAEEGWVTAAALRPCGADGSCGKHGHRAGIICRLNLQLRNHCKFSCCLQ